MCLNYSESNPPAPTVHGKFVFHETGSWCQKGWECCIKMSNVDMRHLRYLRPDIKSLTGDGVRTFGPFS